MKKRAIALFLSLLLLGSLAMSAFAADEGDIRVTIGADLNADEIAKVYEIFGVDRGQVEELIVTNADERAYLEGLVSDAAIGTRAISCTYLEVLGPPPPASRTRRSSSRRRLRSPAPPPSPASTRPMRSSPASRSTRRPRRSPRRSSPLRRSSRRTSEMRTASRLSTSSS